MTKLARLVPLAVLAAAACHHASAGAGSTPAPASSNKSAAASMPAGVTPQLIAQGDSIFHGEKSFCQRCHGPNGVGGTNGPSLVAGPWLQSGGSFREITNTIIFGVPATSIIDNAHRFPMNPRGGPMALTDDQSRAVGAYIWSISRAKTAK